MTYTLFYKNIEAKIFPKTAKNSKFECGNFPNESVDQGKHLKHVFWVGGGWEYLYSRCGLVTLNRLARNLLRQIFQKKRFQNIRKDKGW